MKLAHAGKVFLVPVTFKDRLHTFLQLLRDFFDPLLLRLLIRTSVMLLICQFGFLPSVLIHMLLCPHRDRMAYPSASRTDTVRHTGTCFYAWRNCSCGKCYNKKCEDFSSPASRIFLTCFSLLVLLFSIKKP